MQNILQTEICTLKLLWVPRLKFSGTQVVLSPNLDLFSPFLKNHIQSWNVKRDDFFLFFLVTGDGSL